MAQYRDGTVTVTNGSATVTGSATAWTANVSAGQLFIINGINYEVAAVSSNTSLSLTAPYAGTTQAGASYAIHRDYTANHNLPIINRGDVDTAALLRRLVMIVDGAL